MKVVTDDASHLHQALMQAESLSKKSHPSSKAASDNGKVLLLQGPVGPFFKRLQRYLTSEGMDVNRICFNPADLLYSCRKNRIYFSGGFIEWRRWLRKYLHVSRPDVIILFGSERPAHRIARQLAERLGIRVLSLEEGYIRPGFVTMEEGGNNASSPLAGVTPDVFFSPQERTTEVGVPYKSFGKMSRYGAMYYGIRTFLSIGAQKQLFHRRFHWWEECFRWGRNAYRRLAGQGNNFATIQRLLEHWDKHFFLVPLQVSADSNMQAAALGWNSMRLISSSMRSFAVTAPLNTRLVFKIHPLERGHCDYLSFIAEEAQRLGVGDRVDIIDTGSLGLLARHAAGMITINSTSGLSAIHHGIPLLVIGKAVYANPVLAVCANGQPDFDHFWTCHYVAELSIRRGYLEWLKQEALVAGDFYVEDGITQACHGIAEKVTSYLQSDCVGECLASIDPEPRQVSVV
ncbi:MULTISPECIES: hypothetical protein [unclassified Oceanobacter]|uniref:capsular polysaccharide export protein, LipB/KpsS family n=1 Tax=unclassified Oceanobacter TaxID=2620260 RepID=UPI00273775BF|nr:MULTISPECIES: hypothetical protein [unclassified Oceanobacter]MDP2610190.1 hypothetical protein [Oceanobacter sp. 1_MG-2023]MDP2613456.1 hypothetical protein [Oceanobacter sp. 2_MG-2023]